MTTLISILLPIMAAGTIISVLYLVMQEKHGEREEYYIPPAPTPRKEREAAPAAITETEPADAAPVSDAEAVQE